MTQETQGQYLGRIGVCPIENGTCPGKDDPKLCPNKCNAHIIRAKYITNENKESTT